ncbi:hypothetical protein [Streptomyces tendae]|uniref:hypothetical protein n=1 Tax=Streptomyces tendae TaxID=1932 RepID=UPI003D72EB8A
MDEQEPPSRADHRYQLAQDRQQVVGVAVGGDQLAQRQAPAGTVEVDRAAVAPVVEQQAPGGEGVEHGPAHGGQRTVGGESETADAQLRLPQPQHAQPGRVDPAVTVGVGQAHAHRLAVGRPVFAVEADVPLADRRLRLAAPVGVRLGQLEVVPEGRRLGGDGGHAVVPDPAARRRFGRSP